MSTLNRTNRGLGDELRGEPAPSRHGFARAIEVVLLVCVFALPLLYSRSAREPFSVPKKAAVATIACVLTAAILLGSRGRRRIGWPAIALAGLALLAASRMAWSSSPTLVLGGLRDLVLVAAPACFLGAVVFSGPRRLGRMLEAIGWSGCLIACIGIMQQQDLDWWGFRPWPPREPGSGAHPGSLGPHPDLLRFPPFAGVVGVIYQALGILGSPNQDYAAFGPLAGAVRFIHHEWLIGRPFSRLPTNDGAASVFGHPNVAAEVVAMAVGAHLARLMGAVAKMRRGLRPVLRALPGVGARALSLASMGFYLLVTGTRGAWVAVAAVALVAATAQVVGGGPAGLLRRVIVVVAILGSMTGAVLLLDRTVAIAGRGGGAPESILDRLRQLRERPDPARDTVRERLTLWGNTRAAMARAASDDPLAVVFGAGAGTWVENYSRAAFLKQRHVPGTYTLERYPDHPHQDPLEFGFEFGLAGGVIAALVAGAAIAQASGRLRREDARTAALGVLLVLAAIATTSMFSFPLHGAIPLFWTFLLIGATASRWPGDAADDVALDPRAAEPGLGLMVPATGLVFATFAIVIGAPAAAVLALAGGAVAWARQAFRARGRARPAQVAGWLLIVLPLAAAGVAARTSRLDLLAVGAATMLLLLSRLLAPGASAAVPAGALRIAAAVLVGLSVAAWCGGVARVDSSADRAFGLDMRWAARQSSAERDDSLALARTALDRATASNPADYIAELDRSEVVFAQGDAAEAEASLKRVLDIHPDLANAYVALANIYYAAGKLDLAMRSARTARQLNPDAYQARAIWGLIMLGKGSRELAAGEFEYAIELAPGHVLPDARVNVAQIYIDDERELGRATQHLEAAASEAAGYAPILRQVAALYQHPNLPVEFHAKGALLWKRALELDPLDPEGRFRVAIEPLRGLGHLPDDLELARIVNELESAAAVAPNRLQTQIRFFRALALERLGRRAEAERGYRDVMVLGARLHDRTPEDESCLHAAIEAVNALRESGGGPETRTEGADSKPATRPVLPGDGR